MSDYLLPETVNEILKRLPVKSLLRFRCVCKEWHSLISSSVFISQHLSHSSSPFSTPSRTLVRHYSKTHSKEIYTVYNDDTFNADNSNRLSFPFHDKADYYFRIVGYCNGMLCLYDDLFGCKDTIILWNPSIKRAISLPTSKVVVDPFAPNMFALGFGFDSTKNDYKVVRVGYFVPDTVKVPPRVPPRVEVYSVSLGKWRFVKTTTKAVITRTFWSQAVIDGFVHWNAFVMTGISEDNGEKSVRNTVLKFDLGSNKFGEIELPEALTYAATVRLLVVVLGGSLSVVVYDEYLKNVIKMDYTTSCTIWVMKEYENVESWAKLYNIKLDGGLGIVLGMRRCGDIVLTTYSGKLVSYNCESGRVSSTGMRGTRCSFFMDDYVESLLLLGKGEQVRGIEPEDDHEEEDKKVQKVENWQRQVVMANVIGFLMFYSYSCSKQLQA